MAELNDMDEMLLWAKAKREYNEELLKNLKRLEKETEHIRREIDNIENSFLMKIEESLLWFLFPWTTFVKKKRMKKIEEIKYQNREILKEYEDAKNRYRASTLILNH